MAEATTGKVLSEKDGKYTLFIEFDGSQVGYRPKTPAESRALKAALESKTKIPVIPTDDGGGWKPLVTEP
jgi:hypothetical protein